MVEQHGFLNRRVLNFLKKEGWGAEFFVLHPSQILTIFLLNSASIKTEPRFCRGRHFDDGMKNRSLVPIKFF